VQHAGQDRTENLAPFSLAGDIDGAFQPANFPVGTNTLTVTAYSQANLGGIPLASSTISFEVLDQAVNGPPIILTQENSDRAVAINAATFTVGPFSLFTENNFNPDRRTRLILFATNLQVSAGATIFAENATLGSVSLPIEFIGVVPDFNWLTQIKVTLPDRLADAGDVWLRLVSSGVSSNQARITIKPSGVAAMIWSSLNEPPRWIVLRGVMRGRRLPWQFEVN